MLAFLLALPLLHAQVNTEKLRLSPEEEGSTAQLGIAFTTRSGNVDTFDASADFGVAWRKGRNLAFLVGSSRYAAKLTRDDRIEAYRADEELSLWSPDARYAHAHLLAARYNRDLNERVVGELFGQLEYNEFLLLDLRSLAGAGARILLFEDERGSGHLGVGAMAEYEDLDPDEIAPDEQRFTLAPRMTSYLTFTLGLGDDGSLSSTTYLQPRIDAPDDLRIYDETELSYSITERLSWSLALKLRYDSDPPKLADDGEGPVPPEEEHLRPLDTSVVNRFSLTF